GGGNHDCTLSSNTVVTGGWTRYTCTFTPASNVTALYFKQTDATLGSPRFYLDDVRLEAGTSATPFSIGNLNLRGTVNSPLTVQNAQDSTTAFQIQNAAGTSNLLVADTLNSRV